MSRCGKIPFGCQRCDDVCAQRDGKHGREDYKKKKQVQVFYLAYSTFVLFDMHIRVFLKRHFEKK